MRRFRCSHEGKKTSRIIDRYVRENFSIQLDSGALQPTNELAV